MRRSRKHSLSRSAKGNGILSCGFVERKTLAWTISKIVTILLRHGVFADREIDGAVHWSSLCSKLRHASQ